MKCSIVFSTFNRGYLLPKVFESIRCQDVSFEYEIIVVDDGSDDDTKEVCDHYKVDSYNYLDRPYWSGPAKARNIGYRQARGDIVLCQASDIVHYSANCIERLCEIEPRTYNIGVVYGCDKEGAIESQYCGYPMHDAPTPCPSEPFNPALFLGSVRRKDLYAVGGDDEDFSMMACEDHWLTDRLAKCRGLRINWRKDVVGHHQWHERPKKHFEGTYAQALNLLAAKRAASEASGEWVASGGSWAYTEK